MQFGKAAVKVSSRLKRAFPLLQDSIGIKTYINDTLLQLRDNPLRFNGNVYLLTSNYTFSSATDFAWAFKYFRTGIIVGKETGGSTVCFGDLVGQILNNTKLKFGISWKKFYGYGASDEDVTGVIPDYQVDPKKAMDFTINLIKQRQETQE